MRSDFVQSRRRFLLGAVTAATIVSVSGPALAMNKADAEALIKSVAGEILHIIEEHQSEDRIYREFRALLEKYADIQIIARSSLGFDWRAATSSQRERYVEAFSGYLARKYGKRFREFVGSEIVVRRVRPVKSAFLVESLFTTSGSSPIALDWQVSDKSGSTRIFNLYVEGVSLLATERTEIGILLDKSDGNIDKVIERLNTLG